MNKTKRLVKNIALSGMFIAIGHTLPFLTGSIPQIGKMMLPMHIPVMLCGLVCGWQYGAVVGFIVPLFRSVLFSQPVMYPTAIAMAFELAAYGMIAGMVYSASRWQCIRSLYRSLIAAMLGGRMVYGLLMTILLMRGDNHYSFGAFISGAIINALPGIILQLVFIPAIMVALDRTKLVPFRKGGAKSTEATL